MTATTEGAGSCRLVGRFRMGPGRDMFVALRWFAVVFPLFAVSLPPSASRMRGTETTSSEALIRFAYRSIDFRLDTCETPERHEPEAMGGAVAVFYANNRGRRDVFFAKCANVATLT